MPLPPRWIRRTVLAPLLLVLFLALFATMPLWILITAAISPFGSGRFRPLRASWLVAVYLFLEAVALIALFAMWVGAGFGWKVRSPGFQRAHYVLTGSFLRALFAQARWVLRLKIEVIGADPDTAVPGPQLVFSRHAGPGDSFIVVHALVNWYDREPRIVLKDTLQWDPVIDVVLNRLPSRFIATGDVDHHPAESREQQITALASDLDDNDALVLFPEGGNFTPRRKMRAIARLRELGLLEMARRAEQWRHVMAPKPGGLLAAVDAAPTAGITWVAHAGLDRLVTVRDIWREVPMDRQITMRWWSVPPSEIPTGRHERIEWMYDWWTRVDTWIADQHRSPTRSWGSG
jgi:1-acyl-sn-glycerol-3-phosphate acyltransferase